MGSPELLIQAVELVGDLPIMELAELVVRE
jgi:hypothetical protein